MEKHAWCAIHSLQEIMNMKYKRGTLSRTNLFSIMESLKFVFYLQKFQKLVNIPEVYLLAKDLFAGF